MCMCQVELAREWLICTCTYLPVVHYSQLTFSPQPSISVLNACFANNVVCREASLLYVYMYAAEQHSVWMWDMPTCFHKLWTRYVIVHACTIMRLPLKHIPMHYTRLGEWTHPLLHTCTTDLIFGGGSVLCVLGVVGLFETSKGTNHVIGRMTTLTNTFLAPYTLYFYSLCVVWAV